MKLKIFGTLAALMITVAVSAQQKDKKILDRSVNRIENMCQTVKLTPELKQKAVDITYDYFVEYDKLRAQEAEKSVKSKSTSGYYKKIETLIPADQLDAFKAWKALPPKERDAKVAK